MKYIITFVKYEIMAVLILIGCGILLRVVSQAAECIPIAIGVTVLYAVYKTCKQYQSPSKS